MSIFRIALIMALLAAPITFGCGSSTAEEEPLAAEEGSGDEAVAEAPADDMGAEEAPADDMGAEEAPADEAGGDEEAY